MTRNEVVGGSHKPALVLADALTRQGYAVLRYDKRGVAQSTGDYSSATILDFASDVTAATLAPEVLSLTEHWIAEHTR